MRIYPKASPARQKESSLAETAFTFLVCDHLQTTRILLVFLILLHWAKHFCLLSTELRQNRADLPQTGWVDEGHTCLLAFTVKVPVPRIPGEWKLLEDTYFLDNELQVYASGVGLRNYWLNQAVITVFTHQDPFPLLGAEYPQNHRCLRTCLCYRLSSSIPSQYLVSITIGFKFLCCDPCIQLGD